MVTYVLDLANDTIFLACEKCPEFFSMLSKMCTVHVYTCKDKYALKPSWKVHIACPSAAFYSTVFTLRATAMRYFLKWLGLRFGVGLFLEQQTYLQATQ